MIPDGALGGGGDGCRQAEVRPHFTLLIQLLPLWTTQEEEHLTFDYNVTFQARGSQQSSHGGVDYPKPSSSQGKTSLFFVVVK